MMSYWTKRIKQAQQNYSDKSILEINKQLIKLYNHSRNQIIKDFENTYLKILQSVGEGRKPTPADLYNLDTYMEMEAQLRNELQRLGDKQVALLGRRFIAEYKDIHDVLAIKGDAAVSTSMAKQVAEQVWCADGLTWSKRVWNNIAELQNTLEEELMNCVVTGRKTSDLKKMLQERFNVSYSNANRIVRTEIAHIETKASLDRYREHGVEEVQVLVDTDARTCPICSAMEGKRIPIAAAQEGVNIPPFHPNCRCCVIPIAKF